MKHKISIGSMTVLVGLLLTVSPVFAHVTVKPGEVGVGQRLNFVISVPTEEATSTVNIRLVLPDGLQSVRPNVKPGWNIQLKKTGEGEEAKITEIIWSGGNIPAEQRDEFVFSAQAPATETTLVWKAYQTYNDGDVVAWDNSPEVVAEHTKNNLPKEGEDDHNAPRPYSETKVINDLTGTTPGTKTTDISAQTEKSGDRTALILAGVAIVMSGLSLYKLYNLKRA